MYAGRFGNASDDGVSSEISGVAPLDLGLWNSDERLLASRVSPVAIQHGVLLYIVGGDIGGSALDSVERTSR